MRRFRVRGRVWGRLKLRMRGRGRGRGRGRVRVRVRVWVRVRLRLRLRIRIRGRVRVRVKGRVRVRVRTVSAESSLPSPILHASSCAPGATPSRSGASSKLAATMPATCVPCEPASVTMHSVSPSSYTCTQ